MRQTLRVFIGILWCLLGGTCALGGTTQPSTRPIAPQVTPVGMYINNIRGLDLKAATYTIDFYIWFRWSGPYNPSSFEFLNGSLDLKEHPYWQSANGMEYISYHCRGVFHIDFDYHRYPLDSHELVLEMEDGVYDASQIRYVVDTQNMQNLHPLTVAGWTVGQPRLEVADHLYHTNFGEPQDKTGEGSVYSRLTCSIEISRHSFSIYIKTFLGIFIAVGIAYLSFLFKPGEVDPRFAVGVAAIFAAVSSEFMSTANLPEMPYLTMADKVHLFSMFMIFVSLLQSCLSLRFFREGRRHLCVQIDRMSRVWFLVVYGVGVVGISLWG